MKNKEVSKSHKTTIVPEHINSLAVAQNLTGQKIRQYQMVSLISTTNKAQVYRAYDEKMHNRIVAIKIFSHLPQHETIPAKIDSPYIVELYDFFTENHQHFLVMEYFPYTLLSYVQECGVFSFHDAKQVILDIATGLADIHKEGVCHADIKPANILLKKQEQIYYIKLADFGLSFDIAQNNLPPGQTPLYAPTEAKLEKTTSGDVYSLTLTYYFILTGKNPPFSKQEFPRLVPDAFIETISRSLKPPYIKDAKEMLSVLQNFFCSTTSYFKQYVFLLFFSFIWAIIFSAENWSVYDATIGVFPNNAHPNFVIVDLENWPLTDAQEEQFANALAQIIEDDPGLLAFNIYFDETSRWGKKEKIINLLDLVREKLLIVCEIDFALRKTTPPSFGLVQDWEKGFSHFNLSSQGFIHKMPAYFIDNGKISYSFAHSFVSKALAQKMYIEGEKLSIGTSEKKIELYLEQDSYWLENRPLKNLQTVKISTVDKNIRGFFKNKWLLFGLPHSLSDGWLTARCAVSSTILQANTIHQIFAQKTFKPFPQPLRFLIILSLSMAIFFIVSFKRKKRIVCIISLLSILVIGNSFVSPYILPYTSILLTFVIFGSLSRFNSRLHL